MADVAQFTEGYSACSERRTRKDSGYGPAFTVALFPPPDRHVFMGAPPMPMLWWMATHQHGIGKLVLRGRVSPFVLECLI
jgi:hypothetical protein